MPEYYCQDDTGRFVLTRAARNRIKMAARELRRQLGLTLEDMAARTAASKSQWHHYENVDAPDLIPAHIYLPLELELGHAPVTRAFAAMNGLTVTSEAKASKRAEVAELTALMAREGGEALATLVESAVDGTITPNEAHKIRAEFADVGRLAERVQDLATGIITGEEG